MAHELKTNNDMVYNSQNGMPWHRLGIALPDLATLKEVETACPGLFSPVKLEQVERNGTEVEGKFYTVKEDTDTVLGIVGDRYSILQNRDAFDFMDQMMQDKNGPKVETAGMLYGGRTVWMLCKLGEFIEVVPGDLVNPYILVANSHDGSSAVRFLETTVRVVCQNTLNMAHSQQGRKFSVRHSGNVLSKCKSASDALGIVRQDFALTAELFKSLAKVEPTKEQIAEVFDALLPATKSKRSELQRARVLQYAESGMGNTPVAGTAWALLNGFTEVEDHFNNKDSKDPDADSMRLHSIWFGTGAQRKANALQVISEVCLK